MPNAAGLSVALVCSLLMQLFDINGKAQLVPQDMFYNTDIGSRPEHMATMQQWLLQPSMAFSYARYPFLLTPNIKASLLTWINSNVMALQMTRNLFSGALDGDKDVRWVGAKGGGKGKQPGGERVSRPWRRRYSRRSALL